MHCAPRLLAHRWIVVTLLGLFGLQFTSAPVVAQDDSSLSPKQKKKLKKKLQQTYKEGAKAGNAKNFTMAIARFQKSIKLAKKLGLTDLAGKIERKNLVESLKGAGSAALKKKNYKKALSHYEKLRQYTSQDPTVHYNRGLALINMGSTKAGLKSLRKAIDIGNKTGNTRVAGLATKRIRDEFLHKASKALHRDNPSQWRISTALDALDQMREYVDPNAKSLFYRATALFEDGQYRKAIQTARKGLDMHQGSRSDAAKFYYVIAESQWETDSKASACETFKNAAYGNYQARANHTLENECENPNVVAKYSSGNRPEDKTSTLDTKENKPDHQSNESSVPSSESDQSRKDIIKTDKKRSKFPTKERRNNKNEKKRKKISKKARSNVGRKKEDSPSDNRRVRSDVDVEIPNTMMKRPHGIAVVIGIKEYQNKDVPDVDYALRDAQIMKKYLTHTLGFQKKNIIYVKNATAADLNRVFGTADNPKGKLYDWVKPNKSEVYVYYSGHGAPSTKSGKTYFVPSNADPTYLSQNGYPVNQLYENLAQIPAKSVTVVLATCFSGVSDDGPLIQQARSTVLSVENPVMAMENGLAFTAGAADQIASSYPKKKHGLFTYFFLKGLRGAADANDNRMVTGTEIKKYLTDKVPHRARREYSREQTPQVIGPNKDRVLVRFKETHSTRDQ